MNTSEFLGYVSIACWLGAQFPQVVMNWRKKSVDGLALPFLANWLLGDISNLVGCLLTKQLLFQTILASYFCIVDFTLFTQYFYYDYFKPSPPTRRRTRRMSSSGYISSSTIGVGRSISVDRGRTASTDHLRELSAAAQGVAQAAAALEEERRARFASRSRSRRPGANMSMSAELPRRPSMHQSDAPSTAGTVTLDDEIGPGMDGSLVSEASTRRVTWVDPSRQQHTRSPSRPSRGVSRSLTRGESASSSGTHHHLHPHPLPLHAHHHYASAVPQLSVISGTPQPSVSPLALGGGDSETTPTGLRSDSDTSYPFSSPASGTQPLANSIDRGRPLGPAANLHPEFGTQQPLEFPASADHDGDDEQRGREERERERKRRSSRASRRSASIVFMGLWIVAGLGIHTRSRWTSSSDGVVVGAVDFTSSSGLIASTSPLPLPPSSSDPLFFDTTSHKDKDKPKHTPPPPEEAPPGPVPSDGVSRERIIGRISAWMCTTLYLTSRLPQIWKNFVRKSCEGLSMALFIFAFLGNLFYVLGILATPFDAPEKRTAFLKESVPYLLGSGGTLVFDVTIVIQSFVYAPKRMFARRASSSDEEEGLLANGGHS